MEITKKEIGTVTEEIEIIEKEIEINRHIVRLYWLNTENFSDVIYQEYYKKLSPARRQKAGSYHYTRDRWLSVGAGVLLDKGLSYYGLKEAGVQLSYNENGKPFLPGFPEIHFNLSHSGTMVFAVFTDTEAGCDIEKIKPVDLGVARRFFCEGEYRYLAGQESETGQQEAFFHLWTLKESFVKAEGAGLLIPLNSFEIEIVPGDCRNYIMENNISVKILQNTDNADNINNAGNKDNTNTTEYYFQSYTRNGYCASICLEEKDIINVY